MRRFIASLPGKVLSHIVIAALVVPNFVLGLSAKAEAQDSPFSSKKKIAIVPFINKKDSKVPDYGFKAQESTYKAFLRFENKFEVETPDSVKRQAETLGLQLPLVGIQNVIRVASELRLESIFAGEVVDYRIDKTAAGKQARVSVRLFEYDVASTLVTNGAAVSAASLVRSSDTADEILIEDALNQAALSASDTVNRQVIRKGTVLNTIGKQALINRGSRDGMKPGMDVVIKRGLTQQVGTGSIIEVTPDKATIRIAKSDLGVAPQDSVIPVFQVPNIVPGFSADGSPTVSKPKSRRASSSFVTTLLVVGLVAWLVSGSEGRNGSATEEVNAEAVVDPTNGPAIRVRWETNGFAKGNSVKQFWQVFRSDISDVPVRLASGSANSVLDVTTGVASMVSLNLPPNNFSICNGFNNNQGPTTTSGISFGRPYRYTVQLIFALPPSDILGGGSGGLTAGLTAGGNTGATGGATTTGTTTGTTTTGTTAGATTTGTTATTTTGTTSTTAAAGTTGGVIPPVVANFCYFASAKRESRGLATPFEQPTLISPANAAVLVSPVQFSFNSVVRPQFPNVAVQYVIQISSTSNFARGTFIQQNVGDPRSETGILATSPIDLNANIPAVLLNARDLYWRIGARNVADVPGPEPDGFTQQRFIFSGINRLTRPGSPPPPPSN